MAFKSKFYPESKFGGFSNIDGTVAFYARINALLSPASVVLDFGCGKGIYQQDPLVWRRALRMLRGKVKNVLGLDVDPTATENPYIDEFRLLTNENWPVEDGSIDLVISDNVMEHLKAPDVFFGECFRVLKPGGFLCIRTPNAWNYVAFISRLVPNKFHSKVTSLVQDGRKEETVFPTYYRCNSLPRMCSLLKKHGFSNHVVLGYEAEPSYLSFSRLAYWLGTLHQKMAPGFLRAAIFAFGQKEAGRPKTYPGAGTDA
jgi:SAM-dependent methyltransferase